MDLERDHKDRNFVKKKKKELGKRNRIRGYLSMEKIVTNKTGFSILFLKWNKLIFIQIRRSINIFFKRDGGDKGEKKMGLRT